MRSKQVALSVNPVGESTDVCNCCGKPSNTLWGYIDIHDQTVAAYFVHWTVGSEPPSVNFDIIVGSCEDDADPRDRRLISLLFEQSGSGGRLTFIDGSSRPANDPELCAGALTPSEVVGTPLAKEVSEYVDAIWLQDHRLSEVRA